MWPSPHSKGQISLLCVLKNIFSSLQITFSNYQSLLGLEVLYLVLRNLPWSTTVIIILSLNLFLNINMILSNL